jgi:hypothetical protein
MSSVPSDTEDVVYLLKSSSTGSSSPSPPESLSASQDTSLPPRASVICTNCRYTGAEVVVMNYTYLASVLMLLFFSVTGALITLIEMLKVSLNGQVLDVRGAI